MVLILILHVLALGILLNRLPYRLATVLGAFAYLLVFYLACGHYLAAHPEAYTPPQPLEDDYYRNSKAERRPAFDPQLQGNEGKANDARPADEEENEQLEEMRIERLKRQQIQTDYQPSTKP